MFLGTNYIPQLLMGNLRPTALLISSSETVKNEKIIDHQLSKKKWLKDSENLKTEK